MIVRQTFSELIARMRSRRCPGGFVHFATRPVAPDTEVVLFDEDDFHDDDTIQVEGRAVPVLDALSTWDLGSILRNLESRVRDPSVSSICQATEYYLARDAFWSPAAHE